MSEHLELLKHTLAAARTEVAKVMIGQRSVVDACLIAIFTGQHLLIEGVPGVGKTLLVRTLARVLGCEFSRIQFTPDLMPADITGTNVFNIRDGHFTLVHGPVFTSFLLADEINRAPAKTQSALLQAMQERNVTIDRETHALPANFTVFATQNPLEYEGTYPLPEAQKDRFLLKVTVDYPVREDELRLAGQMLGDDTPEALLERNLVQSVLAAEHLPPLRSALAGIFVKDELISYIVDLIRQTRASEHIATGAGPRATQALLLASRVFAAIDGRDFVTPDDVRALLHPVLCHRLILRPEYEIEGLTVAEAVREVVEKVPVPR
ncbi:MAG: AAA family ATPase [Verrucomicrobiales bacterium]